MLIYQFKYTRIQNFSVIYISKNKVNKYFSQPCHNIIPPCSNNMEYLNGNDPSAVDYNQVNSERPDACEAIADFYDGAVLMVTGGTGFVGNNPLVTLLHTCLH